MILVVAFVSILLHCVGLFSIYLYKKRVNQNIILTALSITEILAATHRIVFDIRNHIINHGGRTNSGNYSITPASPVSAVMERTLWYVAKYQLLMIVYVLTFDRFMCAIAPLKYKSRMTRRRTILLMLSSVIFASTFGISTGLIPNVHIWAKLNGFGMILMVMCIIFIVLVYSFIIVKIRKSREEFGRERGKGKEFLVPSVLTMTYVVTMIVPMGIHNFYRWNGK